MMTIRSGRNRADAKTEGHQMDPEDYQPENFIFDTPMTVGVDDEFDDAYDYDIPTNSFDESY